MSSHLINNAKVMREVIGDVLIKEQKLSHDTEAKGPSGIGGLFPFHGSRSFSHIFATKDDEYYFNFNVGGINPKYKKELQPIFDDNKRLIYYVNAIFDACISHFDGLVFKNRVADIPSLARVEYNCHDGGRYAKEESFLSLAYLCDYYEVQAKKEIVKNYIREHQLYDPKRCIFTGKNIPLFNKVPLKIMFEYGCGDARSTFDLGNTVVRCLNYKDKNSDDIEEKGMIDVAKNEIELTSVLIDMKIDGCKAWVEYIEKAAQAERKTSEVLHQEISQLTGGINLNSGKQVAEYLISKGVVVPRKEPTITALERASTWKAKAAAIKEQIDSGKLNSRQLASKEKHYKQALEKIEEYKKGNYITDKKTLQRLMNKYPDLDFLSKISEAKEADKKLNTYYLNFLKMKDHNDIIHCSLNQEKAITGRFSSSDPNFQNLHKEKFNGVYDDSIPY